MKTLIAAALLLAVAACGSPRVELTDLDGKNGTNNAFRIKIDRNAECPRAVYAQELYESLEKRDPIFAAKVRVDRSERRRMEIISHEIETQAAVKYCKADETTSRRAEAELMFKGYDGLFSEWSVDEIERRMMYSKGGAVHWLNKHERDLKWK